MEYKQRFLYLVVLFFIIIIVPSSFLLGEIVVTSPAAKDTVKSCSDYTEQVLFARWDMNERTDLGWRIFNSLEMPLSYLKDIFFADGIFSALSVFSGGSNPDYSDAKVFILDSAYLGSAMLGRVGKNFPIDAGKYTRLALRMSLGPDASGPFGQLIWSKDTIYNGVTTSGSFFVHNGWNYYIIDIPSLGIAGGTDPWNGLIDSLRLDPVIKKDQLIKIDWIRLVEYDASTERTITWSGNSGNVDIYLDNNGNHTDGNLGLLARNVSGTNHIFLAGALAPGDYYVAVVPTGTNTFSYSPGYFQVNSVPILRVTKPSEEGSDLDFINVSFNDPWDMSNLEDVEHTERVNN